MEVELERAPGPNHWGTGPRLKSKEAADPPRFDYNPKHPRANAHAVAFGNDKRLKDQQDGEEHSLRNPNYGLEKPNHLKKSTWGATTRFEKEKTDYTAWPILYPKYDLTRPNLHPAKSVMK